MALEERRAAHRHRGVGRVGRQARREGRGRGGSAAQGKRTKAARGRCAGGDARKRGWEADRRLDWECVELDGKATAATGGRDVALCVLSSLLVLNPVGAVSAADDEDDVVGCATGSASSSAAPRALAILLVLDPARRFGTRDLGDYAIDHAADCASDTVDYAADREAACRLLHEVLDLAEYIWRERALGRYRILALEAEHAEHGINERDHVRHSVDDRAKLATLHVDVPSA